MEFNICSTLSEAGLNLGKMCTLNKSGNLRIVFWASIRNRVVTRPARHWNSSESVLPKLLTHVSSRQKCIERSSNSEYVTFCFPPLIVMLQDGLIWDQVLYWRGALLTIDILVRDWMVAISLHFKLASVNWNNFSYLHNTWPDIKASIRKLVLTYFYCCTMHVVELLN